MLPLKCLHLLIIDVLPYICPLAGFPIELVELDVKREMHETGLLLCVCFLRLNLLLSAILNPRSVSYFLASRARRFAFATIPQLFFFFVLLLFCYNVKSLPFYHWRMYSKNFPLLFCLNLRAYPLPAARFYFNSVIHVFTSLIINMPIFLLRICELRVRTGYRTWRMRCPGILSTHRHVHSHTCTHSRER